MKTIKNKYLVYNWVKFMFRKVYKRLRDILQEQTQKYLQKINASIKRIV